LAFKEQALKDKLQLPNLVDAGAKVLGGALGNQEIGSLAMFARSVPPDRIQWGQIPVKDIPGSSDLAVDEANLQSTLAQYRLVDTRVAVQGGMN
jgi:hypothetical protein